MKTVPRILVAGLLLAVLILPLVAFADQLPAPLEKKITSGVTEIAYAGQNLRFSTPVSLIVRFDALSETKIRLTVKLYGSGSSTGTQMSAPTSNLNIYWMNWSSDVYTGPAPGTSESWEGVLNTESGFTEK